MSMLSELFKSLKKSQPLNSPVVDILIGTLISPTDKVKYLSAIDEVESAIAIARMYSPIYADKFKKADDFMSQLKAKLGE